MSVSAFFSGIALAAFGASGIFFLKFWRTSRDRFFLLFCIACWFLAAERVMLLLINEAVRGGSSAATEGSFWVYLMRLAAFVTILVAVVDKNRAKT